MTTALPILSILIAVLSFLLQFFKHKDQKNQALADMDRRLSVLEERLANDIRAIDKLESKLDRLLED